MTSSAHGRVWIGTSGWQYSHWRKRFYPEDLPRDKWLEHYSGLFDTVEVNSSFYGLPEPKSLDHWKESVPSGFRFALKFSRYGSHMKCLKDPRQTLPPFLECLRQLGSAAGPVLVQLKPKWNCNPERLGDFLAALPSSRRWAFEFRDASWFCGEVYSLLEKHNAAMVIHDMLERHPDEATADWSYYRFHGDHYQGEYSQIGAYAIKGGLA